MVQASIIVTRIDVDNLLLEMNDSKEKIQRSKSKGCQTDHHTLRYSVYVNVIYYVDPMRICI